MENFRALGPLKNKNKKNRNEDCEHRHFHFQAIKKNNAKIRIAPHCLFV